MCTFASSAHWSEREHGRCGCCDTIARWSLAHLGLGSSDFSLPRARSTRAPPVPNPKILISTIFLISNSDQILITSAGRVLLALWSWVSGICLSLLLLLLWGLGEGRICINPDARSTQHSSRVTFKCQLCVSHQPQWPCSRSDQRRQKYTHSFLK